MPVMIVIQIALGIVLGLFLFCFLTANLAPVFEARERRRKQKVEEHIHRIMTDPNWEKPKPPKPYDAVNDPWGLLGAVCGAALGLWLMSVLL